MFVTLTDIQNEEASHLQTVIDNTDGKLYAALRGLHYEVSHRNIGHSAGILWRSNLDDKPRKIMIPAGLYTFEYLQNLFTKELPQVSVEIDKATNLVMFSIPTGGALKIPSDIRRLLGISDKGWIDGKYEGDRPSNFDIHKWVYIHLDQLSTTSNIVDGAPSTLLAITPAAPKGVININPICPMYKKLEVGHIHQLNLRALDKHNLLLQNHSKPITVVLEIRENA